MAQASQVIDTPRLRECVGGVGSEEDTILEAYRNSAIDYLEKYMGRCIIDRNNWSTSPADFARSGRGEPDYIVFRVSDVKAGSITLHYTPHDSKPTGQPTSEMIFATTSSLVYRDQDGIAIYSDDDEMWSDMIRFTHPIPHVVVNRGINTTTDPIPSAWGDAVALIVRALYDGTAFDDLGNMSVLKYLLRPYCKPVYGRSARLGG